MIIPINIKDLPARMLQDNKARVELAHNAIRVAAERTRTLLARRTPVDQGQMKNAWRVSGTAENTTVVNDAPHAGIVEAGARPHNVNAAGVEAIRSWVGRHFAGMSDKEQDGITWAIINKIKKYGQKPTWLVRNAMPDIEKFLKAEMEYQLARVK
jgi:hypothetical protein